jgi:hypothetical protein
MAKKALPPDAILILASGTSIKIRRPLPPLMHHSGPTPTATHEEITLSIDQAKALIGHCADDLAAAIEAAELRKSEEKAREIERKQQEIMALQAFQSTPDQQAGRNTIR